MIIPTSKMAWFLIICYFATAILLLEAVEYISPGFHDLYGSKATIGNYFFMPIFWIIYGIIIYNIGVKINSKKVYIESEKFCEMTNKQVIREFTNRHRVLHIPIQYIGLLSVIVGVISVIVQIIYRVIYC